jgi:hypothetical protein
MTEPFDAQEALREFQRAPRPAVFMFQPTRFEVVTGERIEEWERLLRDRVGLSGLRVDESTARGVRTESWCDGGACDCDEL